MKRAQRKARNGDTRDPLFNQSVEKALAILSGGTASRLAG
jgi:hypothetical protein